MRQTEDTTLYQFGVKLAEKRIEVECSYKDTFYFFKDYLDYSPHVDFRVYSHLDEIEKEKPQFPSIFKSDDCLGVGVSEGFTTTETNILLRKILNHMIPHGTIFLHGAAISLNNCCYIFTAPSGTGKTTHILNWKKCFPDTVIINGDKPFINSKTKHVYGTPWCGKEGFNTNTSALLMGIIALEQGKKNTISPITFHEMLPILLQQTYIPKDKEIALKAYKLLGDFKYTPCYKLVCNMDEEAALVAYAGIKANESSLTS